MDITYFLVFGDVLFFPVPLKSLTLEDIFADLALPAALALDAFLADAFGLDAALLAAFARAGLLPAPLAAATGLLILLPLACSLPRWVVAVFFLAVALTGLVLTAALVPEAVF
jgi:hypothetical protein